MPTETKSINALATLVQGSLWRSDASEPSPVSRGMSDVEESAQLRRLADVFRRDATWVFSILRRFGVEARDAEDVTQEVFLVLRGRLAEVTPGEERSFLFRIAGYLAANARRSARRRGPVLPSATDEPVSNRDAERELEERDELEVLQSILDVMTDDLRAAFVLYEIKEMTLPEIADLLAIPIGTVKSRLLRARRVFEREAKRRGAGRATTASEGKKAP